MRNDGSFLRIVAMHIKRCLGCKNLQCMEEDWLYWEMKIMEVEKDINEFSDVVSLASEF